MAVGCQEHLALDDSDRYDGIDEPVLNWPSDASVLTGATGEFCAATIEM